MISLRALIVLAALIVAAAPASAALPAPVRAMIEAAIASGNENEIATLAKYARATNPADGAEVDAMLAARKKVAVVAAPEAPQASSGLFRHWKITGELGGFLTTGNTDTSGITAGLTLNKQGPSWRHKIRAFGDYQRSGSVTTRRQWLASYEPNFKLKDGFYTYGLALYEQDRFQGFTDRITLSGGMGIRAIGSSKATLDVKGGPAWRRTNWLLERDESEVSGLVGADLIWHLTPVIDLTDNAQALWDSENNTYSNTAALAAKFSRAISARLSYSLRHETDPAPNTKKTDTVSRASLVFGF
ncbi:MAG: DUF481 domain-containing protein [Sphingobium sp.]|nr:DUF481 domain-containing protein [Sphingobium sp.]